MSESLKVVDTQVSTPSGLVRHCAERVEQQEATDQDLAFVGVVWSKAGIETWATDMTADEMIQFLEGVVEILKGENDAQQ